MYTAKAERAMSMGVDPKTRDWMTSRYATWRIWVSSRWRKERMRSLKDCSQAYSLMALMPVDVMAMATVKRKSELSRYG